MGRPRGTTAGADPVILEVALTGATPRPSNLELLDEAVSPLAELGRRPATCAEARRALGVPG